MIWMHGFRQHPHGQLRVGNTSMNCPKWLFSAYLFLNNYFKKYWKTTTAQNYYFKSQRCQATYFIHHGFLLGRIICCSKCIGPIFLESQFNWAFLHFFVLRVLCHHCVIFQSMGKWGQSLVKVKAGLNVLNFLKLKGWNYWNWQNLKLFVLCLWILSFQIFEIWERRGLGEQ